MNNPYRHVRAGDQGKRGEQEKRNVAHGVVGVLGKSGPKAPKKSPTAAGEDQSWATESSILHAQ